MENKSEEHGRRVIEARKGRAKARDILAILNHQEYRCALSGEALNPDTKSELDHVIPVAEGGDNSKENLQVVTSKINRMKGTLSNSEFIAICKRVAVWNS